MLWPLRKDYKLGEKSMKMMPGPRQFALVVLIFASSVIGSSQEKGGSKPIVLKGATLIDGTGRPPIPDALIIIDGDKIKAIGGKETTYPSDATVLDLTGKFVIPGLVDSHSHYLRWSGELLLNYGITTALSMNARDAYGEDYYLESQRPDFRTPRLFDFGTNLRLSSSMTQEQVRGTIREWLKMRPEYAKLPPYDSRIKQVFQWANESIHEAGLASIAHTEDCLGAAQAGLDIIEHLWGCAKRLMTPAELEDFEKGRYLHWGLFLKDEARVDRIIKESIQQGGIYLNPTLVYAFGSQSSLAHQHELETYNVTRDTALMAYYPTDLAHGLPLRFRAAQNYSTKYGTLVPLVWLSDKELPQFKEAYHLTGQFVKRWLELGGKIIGGPDDPQTATPGLSVHQEMGMLVESGLTPMQALQAATLWGAEMLTARRKTPTKPMVGRLVAGTFADLVILAANPLDSIENTKKIERVMKGGRFVKLGYTPYYAVSKPHEFTIYPSIPEPEISSIVPNSIVEGSPAFELVVDGEGFTPDSVVRVDDASVPTTFVNIRTLKAKVPSNVVAQAAPTRFTTPSDTKQQAGVYGDRTVKIAVLSGPHLDGGISNSISLKVIAKWLADEKKAAKPGTF